MPESIPDKKYFKIGEVSRISGLEPHVLRFWESEFNIIRPKKDGGNQRLYRKKDIESVLKIKRLLYEEKFTIAGAKEKLKEDLSNSEQLSDGEIKDKLIAIKSGLKEIKDILS